MKKYLLNTTGIFCFLFLIFNTSFFAQNFTWKKGANAANLLGVYGTQSVAAAPNTPGARNGAFSWTDASGNFWLFGGYGYDVSNGAVYLNDLWKYSIATNQWTWISGSSTGSQLGVYGTQGAFAAGNTPGSRTDGASFTDAAGNLWLFGGYGYDNAGSYGELNDLWMYNIQLNQWKWVKGANTCFQTAAYGTLGVAATSNNPGARRKFNGWKDAAGDFWIFGGLGYNASANGDLNDLWKYNITSNQWTWVNGSNLLNQTGTYGTQGTAAASNVPGGRSSACSWTDASGNLWMLGGYGYATSGLANLLSDLWKYNVTSGQWTWINGYNNTTSQLSTYGTLGTFASTNVPGARYNSTTWLDGSGDLWMLGGYGFATSSTPDYLNDLWRYDIAGNQWKWVKGPNQTAQAGSYGLINFTAPTNMPGARGASLSWKDGSNNLWLFGGIGFDGSGNAGNMNDLWKYDNCINPVISIASTNASVCAGVSSTLTASGASTYTWSGLQTTSTLVVAPLGSSGYTVIGTDANGCRDTAYFTETIYLLPVVGSLSSSTMSCPGEAVNLSASGAGTYSWSSSQTGATISVTPTITTTYTVTGTDSNGCSSTSSVTQSVSACAGIATNSAGGNIISVYPNPNKGAFIIRSETGETLALTIINNIGQKVFERIIDTAETTVKTDLPSGIYYYQVSKAGNIQGVGKLIIE